MTNPDGDFSKYREIAPKSVDDAAIKNLMQRYNGDNAAIEIEINNMWHNEKTDGEWNTATKISKTKKDAIVSKQAYLSGGRGSFAGRGRGIIRGDGRGGRSTGRGAAPTPIQGKGYNNSKQQQQQQQQQQQNSQQQEQPTVQQSTPSNGSSGWGGITLAEKLKQAEIQKLLPIPVPEKILPTPAPVDVVTVSSTVEMVDEVVVEEVVIAEEPESAKEIVDEIIDIFILEEVMEEIQVEVPIKVMMFTLSDNQL
jgi:hypothetical protein